jgi:hypothetical protein
MPKAVAGIHHGIGFPHDIVKQRDVTIMALKEGLETEEPSRRATRRCGPFVLPPDSGNVIRGVVDGCFSGVKGLGQYIMLGNAGG